MTIIYIYFECIFELDERSRLVDDYVELEHAFVRVELAVLAVGDEDANGSLLSIVQIAAVHLLDGRGRLGRLRKFYVRNACKNANIINLFTSSLICVCACVLIVVVFFCLLTLCRVGLEVFEYPDVLDVPELLKDATQIGPGGGARAQDEAAAE